MTVGLRPLSSTQPRKSAYREAASALETRDTTITMRLFRARQRIASLVESRPAARGKEARFGVLSVEMGGAGAQPTDADVAVLVALADGSLTPQRRAEAQTAVAASAELRALLEGQVRAVALLRALDVPPPARLRARIEAASAAGAGRRSGEAPKSLDELTRWPGPPPRFSGSPFI